MKGLVIILCIVVAGLRPVFLFKELGPHFESTYQAVAHFLVGGLFCSWYALNRFEAKLFNPDHRNGYGFRAIDWLLNWALLLTAVEVLCATVTIVQKLS